MGRIIGSSFFYQSSAYLDVEGSLWWISARKGLGWQTHNTHSFPAVAGSLRFSPLISSPATTRFYFIPEISVGQAPELVCVLSVFPDSPRCISLWCRIPYALLTSSTRTQDTPCKSPFQIRVCLFLIIHLLVCRIGQSAFTPSTRAKSTGVA